MECNKDEAVRARQIAEASMQRGEFVQALKFAMMAKKLYADVEYVNQILAICEVHNAAQKKLASGSELDWYAILQTQVLADEATIKKQYRRLALLLHPDKNKFAGAEAAFTLIGQANGVLSDQTKRSLYDKKIGISVRCAASRTSQQNPNVEVFAAKSKANTRNTQKKRRSSDGNVFSAKHGTNARNDQKNSDPKFTSFNNQAEQMTFWTACQHCNTKYQYNMLAVNATLTCQNCFKPFTAHVISLGRLGVSPSIFTSVNIQMNAPMPGPPKPAMENTGGKPFGGEHAGMSGLSNPKPMKNCAAGVGHRDGEKSKDGYVPASQGTKSQTFKNVTRKRVRQSTRGSEEDSEEDSEDSFDSRNWNEMNGGITGENDVDSSGVNTRRSSRKKLHVSYVETSEDEDSEIRIKKPRENEPRVDDRDVKKNGYCSPLKSSDPSGSEFQCPYADFNDFEKGKKPRQNEPLVDDRDVKKNGYCSPLKSNDRSGSEFRCPDADFNDFEKGKKPRENEPLVDDRDVKKNGYCSPLKSSDPSGSELQCPDADFNDFEKGKEEDRFAVNQLWAVYDTTDALPRFYALIKKVASPFNLHFTWFEPDPDDDGENDWHDADLPISCGKFILGKSQKTTDRSLFSHQTQCIKGSGKNSYVVRPNKGETWAIFRDWDIKWSSNPEKHSEYENWDIKWSSNPEKHSEYELEYVEILSDFAENVGITVAYLDKVQGFVSLFQRSEKKGLRIFNVPPHELYRFSHGIPSYKMTGNERVGVPIGSFELDPAALPTSLFEVCDLGR